MMKIFIVVILTFLILCFTTSNASESDLRYSLKLCVSTANTTNATSEPVIGASVQCDSNTNVYDTKSDGCTGLMRFASSNYYPFNVRCEIMEGCINTTEFTMSWSDLWSTITSKTAQVQVMKNDESCEFSMAPSSSPVAQPNNSTNNGSDAGTIVAYVVASFAFILLVAILVKTFSSEEWKNNGSDFYGTADNNQNCCRSCLNGCCTSVDCCCCC